MDFDCRFTDRTLTVVPHGSGIKLTITKHDADEFTHRSISVFLDRQAADDLAFELNEGMGFDTPRPTPAPTPTIGARIHDADLVLEIMDALAARRSREG